jgi:hypothetical protein
MATTDENTGNLFEGLISGEDSAKDLVTAFSNKNIQIISPTVAGLLSGFDLPTLNSFKINGCDIDFENNVVTDDDGNKFDLNSILNNNTDNKESESAKEPEFISSLASFSEKVKEMRSSFLPFELYNGATTSSQSFNNISELESYENAFMRMLGMPDDKDVGSSTSSSGNEIFDASVKIIYASPKNTNGQFVKSIATIGEITGEAPPTSDRFADIIAERQRLPSSSGGWGRYFDFGNVLVTAIQSEEYSKSTKKKIEEAGLEGTVISPEDISLNYYKPDHLFRFYYLKSVPIQSSKIYGCVSESQKIVSKPFDSSSFSKINGAKPKTSLLETIIRIRLDRITGSPGIYSTTSNEKDPNGTNPTTIVSPENLGDDALTQVECFLLQKLRKVLIELSKKYIIDISLSAEREVREIEEKTPQEKVESDNKDVKKDVKTLQSELSSLEILKAREDAILFLLKDTSSSYDGQNYGSLYSSLDLQQGSIRTSSGFDDALSGPLYSVLSQRSEYLSKKIKELSELIDKADAAPPGVASAAGISQNLDKADQPSFSQTSYSYLGVCSEDFIIYTMALLSLNQDYLIGLLPQKNRVYLARVISNSSLNSKKDPYGIMDRVNKSVENGGFPSVADSVNALSLLVCKFYSLYISLIKDQQKSLIEQLAAKRAAGGTS